MGRSGLYSSGLQTPHHMNVRETQLAWPASNRCWFSPTPDRLLHALLAVEVLLWLSDQLGWPAWHKGYAVLSAVASVGAAMLLMLGWFITSRVFRWRFQLSIRSLLVLTVAVAVPFNWMSVEMKEARRERDVRKAFTAQRCSVIYASGACVSGMEEEGTNHPAPAWLRALLGVDFFDDVVLARIPPTRGDAAVLTAIELNRLRELDLGLSHVTDAGLAHVQGLTRIRRLRLRDTNFTDAGVVHLKGLTELQSLDVGGTRITDASLEQLKGMPRLRDLWLDGTLVTDQGVKRLRQALPKCKINWTPAKSGSLASRPARPPHHLASGSARGGSRWYKRR
jgi:hypothetical protein